MKEAEYSSLRAEIIGEQSSQANLLIAMYTISIALLTFAIDKGNTYLFALAVYVIILFKLQILWKQTGMMRLSAYLIVKFEQGESEASWESDIIEAEKYRGKELKKWLRLISWSSSAMSTFMILIICALNIGLTWFTMSKNDTRWLGTGLCLIGLFLSLYIDSLQSPGNLLKLFKEEFRQLK